MFFHVLSCSFMFFHVLSCSFIFFFFYYFLHFLSFSFIFFHFPFSFIFFHFLSFSVIFFHFLSFSFIFFHFLSFSFIFCHFLSFSVIFCHFLSFSVIFCHFLSFSLIFFHFPSFSLIFPHFLSFSLMFSPIPFHRSACRPAPATSVEHEDRAPVRWLWSAAVGRFFVQSWRNGWNFSTRRIGRYCWRRGAAPQDRERSLRRLKRKIWSAELDKLRSSYTMAKCPNTWRCFLDDEEATLLVADCALMSLEKLPVLWVWELSQLSSRSRIRGIVTGDTFRREQCAKNFEEACMPFQYALPTRSGTDCVARVVKSMMELDPTKTLLSINGIGAFDHIKRKSKLETLHTNSDLAPLLPFVRLWKYSVYVARRRGSAARDLAGWGGWAGETPSCQRCTLQKFLQVQQSLFKSAGIHFFEREREVGPKQAGITTLGPWRLRIQTPLAPRRGQMRDQRRIEGLWCWPISARRNQLIQRLESGLRVCNFTHQLLDSLFATSVHLPPLSTDHQAVRALQRLGTLSSNLKKNHPMTLSSNDSFIQKHFHPMTLSSNDTFIQMTLSSKKRFHPNFPLPRSWTPGCTGGWEYDKRKPSTNANRWNARTAWRHGERLLDPER